MATPGKPTPSAGGWVDPYRAYNFKVSIAGFTVGHFTECTSIGMKIHTLRYRQGGTQQIVHCLPGPVEYADITLRYGLTHELELWNWFMSAVKGKVERRHASIILMDGDGVGEVLRWNLINAWPSEWRGAHLDAMGRQIAIETMTLVFETLDRG